MLVTLNATKDYLGIPLTDTTYDTFLSLQLEIVSDAIEEYCNRKFAAADYTQTFYLRDFPGPEFPRCLELFHYPVNSIASIVEKQISTDPGVDVSADIRLHKPTGKIDKEYYRSFFINGRILEVTFNAGYATLPNLITSVVLGLVQERYNKKLNGIDLNFGSDVQRISIPGAISIDFDYTLNNNERKNALGVILGSYLNVLDAFRSNRAVLGEARSAYVS